MGGGRSGITREAQAEMKRGTIAWINLEPGSPPEFGKTRPALIVSNSSQNPQVCGRPAIVDPATRNLALTTENQPPQGKNLFRGIAWNTAGEQGENSGSHRDSESAGLARVTEALELYPRD